MIDFPELTGRDSKNFDITYEDVAERDSSENGYLHTRSRHTRPARRTFTTGYTMMPESDREILEDFWNNVRGGSLPFNWRNPVTNETHLVRFGKEPLKPKYTGIGGSHFWSVTNIKLTEV